MLPKRCDVQCRMSVQVKRLRAQREGSGMGYTCMDRLRTRLSTCHGRYIPRIQEHRLTTKDYQIRGGRGNIIPS